MIYTINDVTAEGVENWKSMFITHREAVGKELRNEKNAFGNRCDSTYGPMYDKNGKFLQYKFGVIRNDAAIYSDIYIAAERFVDKFYPNKFTNKDVIKITYVTGKHWQINDDVDYILYKCSIEREKNKTRAKVLDNVLKNSVLFTILFGLYYKYNKHLEVEKNGMLLRNIIGNSHYGTSFILNSKTQIRYGYTVKYEVDSALQILHKGNVFFTAKPQLSYANHFNRRRSILVNPELFEGIDKSAYTINYIKIDSMKKLKSKKKLKPVIAIDLNSDGLLF